MRADGGVEAVSKAVLISIRPKWCEKIISGEKTVEVRKLRPKLKTPFMCYIYCTYGEGLIERLDPCSPNSLIGQNVTKEKTWGNCCNGKVIGEFVCDRIYHIWNDGRFIIDGDQALTNGIARESCLDLRDMRDYLGARDGYAWHISDLRIYDTPRELDSFRRECVNDLRCESCAMYWNNNGTCGNDALHLHRPPQGWCYVEEDDHAEDHD